jgi:hypothetical protein
LIDILTDIGKDLIRKQFGLPITGTPL